MNEIFDEKDAVKVVFSNPTGEKLMAHWFQAFILESAYYPNDDAISMAYRAGQRAAYLSIYNLLNEGDK